MIECEHCFNIVDEDNAVVVNGKSFCSESCAQEYSKEQDGFDMPEMDYDEDKRFLAYSDDDDSDEDLDDTDSLDEDDY